MKHCDSLTTLCCMKMFSRVAVQHKRFALSLSVRAHTLPVCERAEVHSSSIAWESSLQQKQREQLIQKLTELFNE
jgi:hypothetical protein